MIIPPRRANGSKLKSDITNIPDWNEPENEPELNFNSCSVTDLRIKTSLLSRLMLEVVNFIFPIWIDSVA